MDTADNSIQEISATLMPPSLKVTTNGGCRVRIPMDRLVAWRDAREGEDGNAVVIYTGANEHLSEFVEESLDEIDRQVEQA